MDKRIDLILYLIKLKSEGCEIKFSKDTGLKKEVKKGTPG